MVYPITLIVLAVTLVVWAKVAAHEYTYQKCNQIYEYNITAATALYSHITGH